MQQDGTFCMMCFVVMFGWALTLSRRMGLKTPQFWPSGFLKNHCSPRFPFMFLLQSISFRNLLLLSSRLWTNLKCSQLGGQFLQVCIFSNEESFLRATNGRSLSKWFILFQADITLAGQSKIRSYLLRTGFVLGRYF